MFCRKVGGRNSLRASSRNAGCTPNNRSLQQGKRAGLKSVLKMELNQRVIREVNVNIVSSANDRLTINSKHLAVENLLYMFGEKELWVRNPTTFPLCSESAAFR